MSGRLKPIESYCKKAIEIGIGGAKVIDPCSVITAEWVKMKCQFGCDGFGKGLCCPPHTPDPGATRKVIDSYQKAILVHQKAEKEEKRKIFNRSVVLLETKIFLDGYYKALSMGSGPCRLCPKCNPTSFCKHGKEARPSMEACGIDVFRTARENGFHIEVVQSRGEAINIFGLVLIE